MPIGQLVQLEAPGVGLNLPWAHASQLWPATLVEPAPQSKQAAEDVDPVLGLYLPATQLVQLAAPPVGLYVLMGHAWQLWPATLVDPAPQFEHAPEDVDPVLGLYLPATQLVQLPAPAVGLYVLMGHAWQLWPAMLVDPAPQFEHAAMEMEPVLGLYLPATQLVQMAAPPEGSYVLMGQEMHALMDVEPVLGLYDPAPQPVQKAVPGVGLNRPAGQSAHVWPDTLVCPMGQLVHAEAPVEEFCPAGQLVQAATDVDPVDGLYVLTGQPVQLPAEVDPVLVL